MRLYWDRPKSQHHVHDQKLLFVEFSSQDSNVWSYGPVVEWSPTYEEILTILEALLRGEK